MKRLIILLLIFTLISGCINRGQDSTIYRGETIPEFSPVVDMAKKDLAEKLNLQVENILLVKQEAVDWRDSSLGYPEEGIMYSKVITPGFRIILKAGDKSYEYHSDYKRVVAPRIINTQPVATQPVTIQPVNTQTTPGGYAIDKEVVPKYSPVVDMAKKNLAEKLNLQVENIQLVKQEAVDWPDSSLGYPEEGMMYIQVITPGFRIILKADGKLYEYHSDYNRIVGQHEVSP